MHALPVETTTTTKGCYGKVKDAYNIRTLERVAVKIMKQARVKKIRGGLAGAFVLTAIGCWRVWRGLAGGARARRALTCVSLCVHTNRWPSSAVEREIEILTRLRGAPHVLQLIENFIDR